MSRTLEAPKVNLNPGGGEHQPAPRHGISRRAIAIILSVSGVLGLGAAGYGVFAPKPGVGITAEDPDVENPGNSTGGDSGTGENVTEQGPEYTVESLEVSSEQPAEDQGEAIIALLDEWSMSGANEATYNEILSGEFQGTVGELARKVAEENGPIFAEAVFGPDWASDPAIVTMVNGRIDRNADFLENWLITSKESTPFTWTSTDIQVSNVVDNGATIDEDIQFTQNNTAGSNSIGSNYDVEMPALDGTVVNVHIQIVKAGDVAHLGFYSVQS